MSLKYGVLDIKTGETTFVSSKEEAVEIFWKRMISFALPFFHNTPYVIIEEQTDGSSKWFNSNNEDIERILSFEEMNLLLEKERQERLKEYELNDLQKTKVEILP
jgi:thymidine phosphorylase